MDLQTFCFYNTVIILLLAFHIYYIEQKLLNLSDKIEKSAISLTERQTEELKHIFKGNLYNGNI